MTVKELVFSEIPTQVLFYDGEGTAAGIMIGEKIICGCCGAVFEIDDVIENARGDGVPAISWFKNWVDISEEIGQCFRRNQRQHGRRRHPHCGREKGGI